MNSPDMCGKWESTYRSRSSMCASRAPVQRDTYRSRGSMCASRAPVQSDTYGSRGSMCASRAPVQRDTTGSLWVCHIFCSQLWPSSLQHLQVPMGHPKYLSIYTSISSGLLLHMPCFSIQQNRKVRKGIFTSSCSSMEKLLAYIQLIVYKWCGSLTCLCVPASADGSRGWMHAKHPWNET